jgi:hypothetical protein
VTCKRCLGSIHWKLAQLQCQQPGSGGLCSNGAKTWDVSLMSL